MRLKPSKHFQECCLNTFRANIGTWEVNDRILCKNCGSIYLFHSDGYWRHHSTRGDQ